MERLCVLRGDRGPMQLMVDCSLSLHLCKLHQNPLSENVEDIEQPAMHCEMDATVFTEK